MAPVISPPTPAKLLDPSHAQSAQRNYPKPKAWAPRVLVSFNNPGNFSYDMCIELEV